MFHTNGFTNIFGKIKKRREGSLNTLEEKVENTEKEAVVKILEVLLKKGF